MPLEILNLIFYSLQQFGMAFGVGAETIVLIAYLMAVRDGTVDDEEERFTKAARTVAGVGIFLLLASGAGITLTHYLHGETSIVLAPAFLFKWSLIGIVTSLRMLNRGNSLGSGLLEGFSGASWYALFLVHILAPAAGWSILGIIYGGWLVGFALFWTALVFMVRGSRNIRTVQKSETRSAQKSVPTQARTPYQSIYNNQNAPTFPQQQTIARAYSPTAPTTAQDATSTLVPPALPTMPPPPPPAPLAPPVSGQTPFLRNVQVMPRSPNDIRQTA
ncbi:MAG: hypothetical protein WCI89_01785 [bacterium]